MRTTATDRDTASVKVAGAIDAVAKAEVEATKAVAAFGSRLTELELDADQYAVDRRRGRLLCGSFCPIQTFAPHLTKGNSWSRPAVWPTRPRTAAIISSHLKS